MSMWMISFTWTILFQCFLLACFKDVNPQLACCVRTDIDDTLSLSCFYFFNRITGVPKYDHWEVTYQQRSLDNECHISGANLVQICPFGGQTDDEYAQLLLKYVNENADDIVDTYLHDTRLKKHLC